MIKRLFAHKVHDGIYVILALFSCALLLSIGAATWHYQKTTAFILLMIGFQFLSPRFWWTTFLSIIALFLIYLPEFPRLTNHGNLQVFIGLFLLFTLLFRKKTYTNSYFDPELLSKTFRLTLISIYFISGFHKLNSGFFELNGSCVSAINQTLNTFLLGEHYQPNPSVLRFNQIMTLVVEMIVPFGLLHHRTRKITTWVLVMFHFYLSLCNFSNFSSMAGFLIAGSVINFHQPKLPQQVLNGLRYYLFFAMLSSVAVYLISRLSLGQPTLIRFYNALVFNIGWLIFFYFLLKNTTTSKSIGSLSAKPWIAVVFLAFWGTQPYIGLSNTATLTMFSNLLTESSINNHYLIDTKKSKVFHFEEDYITILELSDTLKWQNSQRLSGYALPVIEFKTQVNRWSQQGQGKIPAVLLYQKDTLIIDDLRTSPFSSTKWWYHYIYYRKIPISGINECMW